MLKVIQSNNPDTDTLICPKCGALWRAKGYYDRDEGGWVHELKEEYCPRYCRNLFGFRISGKVQ